MGRSELNGVAAGLAGSFVSRNNDVDGFWSLGLLRLFADQLQLKSLRFDIANGRTEPDAPLLLRVCHTYQASLARQLAARGIDRSMVAHAEILVSFDALGSPSMPPARTYGPPFLCSVRLLDDRKSCTRRGLMIGKPHAG